MHNKKTMQVRSPDTARPSAHLRRAIAVTAICDIRAVDRLYAGKRVRETTAIRILAAIEKLGAQKPPAPVTCLSSDLGLKGVGPLPQPPSPGAPPEPTSPGSQQASSPVPLHPPIDPTAPTAGTAQESMNTSIDIATVKKRLQTAKARNSDAARVYGHDLGSAWAAEGADPEDLEELVSSDASEGIVDEGDRWHGLRKALPSLDDFLSSLEGDNDLEFGRFYRHHPGPLFEGFVVGAEQVLAAVNNEEG